MVAFYVDYKEEKTRIIESTYHMIKIRETLSNIECSKKTIGIFGSCISRDILAYKQNDFLELKEYIARESIVSALSLPIDCSPQDFHIDSAFQKRMVLHDFKKDGLDVLKRCGCEYLLIDFIDERFPLIKIRNSYVTASNELMTSRYFFADQKLKYIKYTSKNIAFRKKYYIESANLDYYLDLFCERIREIVPVDHIILHKAYFSKLYLSKDQKICLFAKNIQNYCKDLNQRLKYMYSYVEKKLPGILVLDLCDRFTANENHKWGLAPMHYQDEYYVELLRDLKMFVTRA